MAKLRKRNKRKNTGNGEEQNIQRKVMQMLYSQRQLQQGLSSSPVPIKRRCSSKVAGSCNQGEFPKRPASETEIQFHTHQREGIQICDHFLLGNCPHGSICELHHTRYPYHWQIKWKDSQVWQSVNDSAQRHLEKLYSDIERVHVKLIDKKALSGKVNLSTLKIDHHGPFSDIRRLSNTSHPEQNPHFPTEWTVYWEDGSIWKKYEEPLSHEFLAAFEDRTQEHVFQLRGHLYTMDFKQSLIYNHNTGNSHTIQLRPTYRSPLQMLPQLWTIPSIASEMRYPPTSSIPGEDPTDGYSGPYPAYWIKRPEGSVPFVQEEVLPSEAAYHTIYTLFHKSLSEDKVLLLSVHRIRNDFLWQKYCSQKDLMSQSLSAQEKLRLQKHLFHSTSAKRLGFTCQIKFDTHLSGSHMYGRGCYFTVSADQADRYAQAEKGGLRHMFLAKVLVGKCTRGKKHYCQPPQKESGSKCFDSCVDNVASPNIYVIFNSYQCYPYFLISYKLLSDPVVLDD
ncbi:protein mono-ADP-ribosyltransferase TIPARP-like [Lepidochelys kempii]|uniref:protein mono-ADP-ribosyltransferase TIPARP-like n=1 Tax=Lepidochelys kempii TaxID=8472 RepID=UPI003C6FA59C